MITSIVLIVVLLVVLYAIVAYNGLVRLNNRVKEAWSDIDVQLKRRYDLIPNLVETVKGYATHEREAFENVTKARSMAMGAKSIGDRAHAETALSGALSGIFAIAEAYPQLRASDNFAKLQDELTDTEDKIQAARRFYNTNVLDLNTRIETFPTNLMASSAGFTKASFFEITAPAEREPVQVKF